MVELVTISESLEVNNTTVKRALLLYSPTKVHCSWFVQGHMHTVVATCEFMNLIIEPFYRYTGKTVTFRTCFKGDNGDKNLAFFYGDKYNIH